MGTLKRAGVVTQQGRANASPADFGAAVGIGLADLGSQVAATAQIKIQVSQTRAREAANNFGADFQAEQQRITADISNIENWDAELDKAQKRLTQQHSSGAFIDKSVFRGQSNQQAAAQRAKLTSVKNAHLVQIGRQAYDNNMSVIVDDYVTAGTDGAREFAVNELVLESNRAVKAGHATRPGADADLRVSLAVASEGAVNRLINEGSLPSLAEARRLLENDVLPVAMSAAKTQKLLVVINDQVRSVTAQQNRAAANERVIREDELKQRHRDATAELNKKTFAGTLEPKDIEPHLDILTREELASYTGYAQTGGGFPKVSYTNPTVLNQALRIASGQEEFDPKSNFALQQNNLQDALIAQVKAGQLPINKAEGLTKAHSDTRLKVSMKMVTEAVNAISLRRTGDAALMVSEILPEVLDYANRNPNASSKDITKFTRALLEVNDIYGMLSNVTPVVNGRDFLLRTDPTNPDSPVDFDRSAKEIARRHRLDPGVAGYFTADQALAAGDLLRDALAREKVLRPGAN